MHRSWYYLSALLLAACYGSHEPGTSRSVPVLDGAEVLYEELFESCTTGWTASGVGSTWQCGAPAVEPTGDNDGTGIAWATGLLGPYGFHEESALSSPPIDLSAHMSAELRLTLFVWYDFAHNASQDFGGARVEAFDGSVWRALLPHGGWDGELRAPGTSLDGAAGLTDAGHIRDWRRLVFDVASFAGPAFRVRVVVANRHPVRASGIAVDTVRIERLATAAERSTAALGRLQVLHHARVRASLASLPREERVRRLERLLWRGIAPAELEVRENPFGAVGMVTSPFARLPASASTVPVDAREAAEAFLAEFGRDLFGLEPLDEVVLDPASPGLARGLPGAVVFKQMFQGLPIVAARAAVHLREDLAVYGAYGTIVPGFNVDPVPSVGELEAGRNARNEAEAQTSVLCATGEPSLLGWNDALAGGEDADRLVWRVRANCGETVARVVFIDAHDGSVRHTYNPVREQGRAEDNFRRFTDANQEYFGPPDDRGGFDVWRDGVCTWEYGFDEAGFPIDGNEVAEGGNCTLVPETDQVILSIEAFNGFAADNQDLWGFVGELAYGCDWLTPDGDREDVVGLCVQFNSSHDVGEISIGSMTEDPLVGGIISLSPDFAGPGSIGHEGIHVLLAAGPAPLRSALQEHAADVGGAIATARALEAGFGDFHEAPDEWVQHGTEVESALLTHPQVRNFFRPCSVLGFPREELPPLTPAELNVELPGDDPRFPDENWRSTREPWLNNRGHCAGPGSLNEEWQTAEEAYAPYYMDLADDGAVRTHAQVLSHTNLGIGNVMLRLFTEGGSYRGFDVAEAAAGFADLEGVLWGGLVHELAPVVEEGAGMAASWTGWTAALVRASCDLDAKLPLEGPGCAEDLNARALGLIDAAAATSIWGPETRLSHTDARVGDGMAAVSRVFAGGAERVYVFYRGGDDLVHYRWLDVTADWHPGTPLADADGAWHPAPFEEGGAIFVGDCVVPDSETIAAPTAVARMDGSSVWVGWVTPEGPVRANRFEEHVAGLGDDCAEDWLAEPMAPAIADAVRFPEFDFEVDGPVALIETPIGREHGFGGGFDCVRDAGPFLGDEFPDGLLALSDWLCHPHFVDELLDPLEQAELLDLVDDAMNPDQVRGAAVSLGEVDMPSRTDDAIGTPIGVPFAAYASVDTALRQRMVTSPLLGEAFEDALDGSGSEEGISAGARFRLIQERVPGTVGTFVDQREMAIALDDYVMYLVWRDPERQVWIHPWDGENELREDVDPNEVMRSGVAPTAVAHKIIDRDFAAGGERWGIYVFGTDVEDPDTEFDERDGAVQVTFSTNELPGVEGLMLFNDPVDPEDRLLLPTLRAPRGTDPEDVGRPRLFRAWTDRQLAVWSRPDRDTRTGSIHFVLFPITRPEGADVLEGLGFNFGHAVDRTLLAGVLDTDADGDLRLRRRERLFSLEATDARDSAADGYFPAPGGGLVAQSDVVFYFDATRRVPDRDESTVDVTVRTKTGQ